MLFLNTVLKIIFRNQTVSSNKYYGKKSRIRETFERDKDFNQG